jgi:hypothetical protein
VATSEIDIVNGALLHCGLKPISSFTENSDAARAATVLYPGARDAMLRMHQWNWAKRRAVLVQDTVNPSSGFDYQYILPADFLMMMKTDDPHTDWSIEGERLLSNETAVTISYIAVVTDPNKWDGLFREALEHWLASKFAGALRNAPQVSRALEEEYKELLRLARVQNSHENPMTNVYDDDLVRARRRNVASPLIPWNDVGP